MVDNFRIPARPPMTNRPQPGYTRINQSQIGSSFLPVRPPPTLPGILGMPGMPAKPPAIPKENFFKSKKFLVLLAGFVLIILIILMIVLLKGNGGQKPISCDSDSDCLGDDVCQGGECVASSSVECNDGETRECGTNDLGECSYGIEACVGGEWSGDCEGEVVPELEVCDGLDNDCDGDADELNVCDSGGGNGNNTCQNNTIRVCGSDLGECAKGNETCVNNVWGNCTGAIYPVNETCDLKDNDCDLSIDEGNVCGIVQDNFEWGFTYGDIRTFYSMGESVYVAGYAKNYSTPEPAGGVPGNVINYLTKGTITGGPNYYTDPSWWKIRWDDGLIGWSAGSSSNNVFLEKVGGGSILGIGDSVKVRNGISSLGVRSIPSESFNSLGSKNGGAIGKIIAGPNKNLLRSGYYIWWKVNFIGLGEIWISEDKIGKASDMPSSISTKFVGWTNVTLNKTEDIMMVPNSNWIILGSKTSGSNGTIAGSPYYVNGEWWWRVNFNENVSFSGEQIELIGWVRESSLYVSQADNFNLGVRIRVKDSVSNLAIRQTPSSSATWLGGKNSWAIGNTTGGPEFNESYYWWKIKWDATLEGWSVANYIELYQADNFNLGVRIRVKDSVSNLAIRQTPSSSATWLGGKNSWAIGHITGGPEFNESYPWHKIKWSDGLEGWSVADYIELYD